MKKQTRNTEVQINEEKIGKIPDIEFRMTVKMIKNLQNKMEKMQESINKDLEELNNSIQGQATQLLKLKIPYKESVAHYLKQNNESISWKIKWWK